jgi:hypothetical protein
MINIDKAITKIVLKSYFLNLLKRIENECREN